MNNSKNNPNQSTHKFGLHRLNSLNPVVIRFTIWGFVVLCIILGAILFFAGLLEPKDVGYTGVFFLNLIGSASVVIPVPGIAAVCAASLDELRLNVIALGLIAGLASTIGELTGYFAGYTGQTLVQKSRYYSRVRNLMTSQGPVALFILSVIPNPIFDVAGIAAGSLGYPLRSFLLWVLIGKVLKFILIGYACRESIDFLMRFI